MNNETRLSLYVMLSKLFESMTIGLQCSVRFRKGDATVERLAQGALAALHDAGYTLEDVETTWRQNFGK